MNKLQKRIESLITQHGGLRAVCRKLEIDPGYLCRLRKGEKENPSDDVLDKLGLVAVVTYKTQRKVSK